MASPLGVGRILGAIALSPTGTPLVEVCASSATRTTHMDRVFYTGWERKITGHAERGRRRVNMSTLLAGFAVMAEPATFFSQGKPYVPSIS